MSDNYGIETRRRSRSKTPATLAQENGDSGKKKSAIPIISLIEEEDDIVEVANPRPKRVRRSKPAADGDSQSSPDKSSQKSASQKSTITTSKSVVSNGNGEHVKSSTVTTTLSETTTAVTDGNQSMFSSIFTAIKTSTPILSSKKSKRRTDINTKDVNVAEHPAYKEYREAGEYWNKFPKTDYTYSELSPHRRELSNGMINMPNMSRKSLDNHAIRVEDMIAQNPLDETFLRKKYLSTSQSTSFQRRTADLLYDSADEVDSLNEFRAQLRARRKRNPKLLVQAFYLSILTFFSSIYAKARSIVVRSPSQSVYTPARRPYYQQKGIFARSFESIQRFFLIGFSKIYLFISTVLCADTWLLYTRSEKTEDNRKRRRFLLGLLALLPLLLFGGVYFYLDPPQEISLPKLTMPSFSLPSVSLPQISLPQLPTLPSVSLPKFTAPSLSLPTISFEWLTWPTWPAWATFSLSWPAWLTFTLPTFTLPRFTLPDLTLPTLSWPAWLTFSFSLPTLSWPTWLTLSVPTLSWPAWLTFSLPVLSWPAWLPDSPDRITWPSISFDWLRLPEFSWPKISLPSLPTISLPSLPSISWPKLPEVSFSWLPEFSLPSFSLPSWFAWPTISISLPSFSFDLSPITGFFYDIYDTVRTFIGDVIDKIIEIIMNFVNEVQVIWSENLNSVTNERVAVPAASTPAVDPVAAPKAVKKVAEKVVKKVVEEVVNVVTAAPQVVENVAKVAQPAN